jgi:hypothetical protein
MCDGEGVVPDPFSEGLVDTKCPVCDGEGEIWFEEDEIPIE